MSSELIKPLDLSSASESKAAAAPPISKVSKRSALTKDETVVTAAGIIPYFVKDGSFRFLVIERNLKTFKAFEAFGGKIEAFDKTPEATAIRECSEESNKLLSFEEKALDCYYISNKYVLYLVKLDKEVEDLAAFGDTESFTGEKREVKVYTFEDLEKSLSIKIDKKFLMPFISTLIKKQTL